MVKKNTGTREWCNFNVNFISGCKNNCKYCYAKKMSIRYNRKTAENWHIMDVKLEKINKKYGKRKGRIMVSSTHDIIPDILPYTMEVLEKLLVVGNEVLITSKPDFYCIKKICDKFLIYQKQIQFRFTIGSMDNKVLEYWEPNAPNFEERLKSMKYAFDNGYKTSVSIEPFLDFDPIPLVNILDQFTTDSIWLGNMNYISNKGLNDDDIKIYNKIRKNYTVQNNRFIYEKLKDHPKIMWKDSIQDKLKIENKKKL